MFRSDSGPTNGLANGVKWNLRDREFYRTNRRAFKTLVLVDNSVNGAIQTLARNNFQKFANVTYGVATITFIGTQVLNNVRDAAAMGNAIRKHSPDLVLLVLGSRDVEAYSQFKDLADRTFGCHSICMTGRIFDAGLAPKMANIMMKANLKAAGSNHTVCEGKLTEIMADTLVLGADVTHPNGGSIAGCPSIAAIVGSVDDHAGRFLGSMRLQSAGKKEMIDDVESMVVERIKDWVVINKFRLPKNIIYYRDGVSEGQYAAVRDEELSKITSAFPRALQELEREHPRQSFNGGAPKLTAIICAKRHHVRFYPESSALPNGNCQPGTYIDDVVTSPYYADFYLQSHEPLHGTARPAHYFILRNETARSVADLRQLTHELCFTYVRTTSAVSYASPAYYADRLCERGRCYIRNFIASTPAGRDLRNDLKVFKRDEENRLAGRRRAEFAASGSGGARRAKGDAERDREMQDRRLVEEACVLHTMERAEKVFYKNGVGKNPWSKRIAQTMFWM
ncbi:hypothetical protein N0V95_007131 [Ascochyta clinopodiicola]|nr:hypothetical protein N0V95_007131 [Ascochyta clinopodiicola]